MYRPSRSEPLSVSFPLKFESVTTVPPYSRVTFAENVTAPPPVRIERERLNRVCR